MKTKNKLNKFNLLIFFNLAWNNHGVARIIFHKPLLNQIIKLIKKNKKQVKSQLVKLVSDFLNLSDNFLKINLSSEVEDIPQNLLFDLSFLLIENYKSLIVFLKNKEKDIVIFTLIKNSTVVNESDWIVEEGRQIVLTKLLSPKYKLNIIAFNEPEKEKYVHENPIHIPGNVKVFLQKTLLQSWVHENDLSVIFTNLKNENIFTALSFNFNATLSQISNNALLNMAQLIHQHLATINQAVIKFQTGLILHFTFDENEQFQFIKIIRW